jgi:hypothetical protein
MVKPTPEYLALPSAKEIVETLVSGNDNTEYRKFPRFGAAPETPHQVNDRLKIELRDEGFPNIQVRMFRKTANHLNCIVMSRAPGDATPMLIEHGHDLKGYQVKSKSCSWGPMAGFLCQLPCFNKVGNAKIDYNDGNYVNYFEFIKKIQKKEPEFKKRVAREDNPFTPFVPLQLFNLKKEDVLKNSNGSIIFQKKVSTPLSPKPEDQDVYGVAAHLLDPKEKNSGTVYMEFLLRRATRTVDPKAKTTDPEMLTTPKGETLWNVYHGRVLYLETNGKTPEWCNYYDRKMSSMDGPAGNEVIHAYDKKTKKGGVKAGTLLSEEGMPSNLVDPKLYKRIEAPDVALQNELLNQFENQNVLNSALRTKLGKHPGFLPLCVAQNHTPPFDPQPQYKKGEKDGESDTDYAEYLKTVEKHRYKNAVTGDYDLFAVWPSSKGYGWQDLARTSDIQKLIKDVGKERRIDKSKVEHKIDAFDTVRGKQLAVGLIGSPDVMIDVIPSYIDIAHWESKAVGNISSLSFLAGGTLNGFILDHYLKVARPQFEEDGVHHFAYANHAFHSDEGGRPGIDEIDFPVGVFLPRRIAAIFDVQRLLNPNYEVGDGLISSILFKKQEYAKFLALIVAVRNACYVPLNHVWITYLFGLVTETTPAKGMFENMEKERQDLTPDGLKEIRTLLAQLFLGGKYRVARPGYGIGGRWGMYGRARFPTEVNYADQAMEDIAKAFISAEEHKDYKKKLEIIRAVELTIPDRSNPLSDSHKSLASNIEETDSDVSAIPAPSLANWLEPRE